MLARSELSRFPRIAALLPIAMAIIWQSARRLNRFGPDRVWCCNTPTASRHLRPYWEQPPRNCSASCWTAAGATFYLKRQAGPDLADKVLSLDIPGVYLEPEYKRYYPQAEMTAHIIGFTDIDDIGQEGIELAYDDWLRGRPGKKRVLKDRLGRVVEQVEGIQSSESGRELALSIDRRIQYLAYRELKTAVIRHKAKGGSLVLLDVTTGEVLALVGQPSYNPNNRSDLRSEYYRNRAVTDVFEPGSVLKPFTILAALSSGLYKPDTLIDTRPGYLKVGDHVIRDI